ESRPQRSSAGPDSAGEADRPSGPGRQRRFVPFGRPEGRGGPPRPQTPEPEHHRGGTPPGSPPLAGDATHGGRFSRRGGARRRLRDLMTTQVRRLAEIDGQLRLAQAQDDSAKILSSLTDISSVLVEVQFARAQLGLAV